MRLRPSLRTSGVTPGEEALDGLRSPRVEDAGELAGGRVPAQHTSRRVRSFRVMPGYLQGSSVEGVDVPGAVGDEHRMLRGDGIEVVAGQEARLHRLGVVVLEALDPLAGGRLAGALPQGLLDLADAAQGAVGRHDVPYATAEDVDVRINESGDDGGALYVQHGGVGSLQVLDVLVAANGDKAPAAYG